MGFLRNALFPIIASYEWGREIAGKEPVVTTRVYDENDIPMAMYVIWVLSALAFLALGSVLMGWKFTLLVLALLIFIPAVVGYFLAKLTKGRRKKEKRPPCA